MREYHDAICEMASGSPEGEILCGHILARRSLPNGYEEWDVQSSITGREYLVTLDTDRIPIECVETTEELDFDSEEEATEPEPFNPRLGRRGGDHYSL